MMSVNKVVLGDSIEILREQDSSSVHLILSDIPYGIAADEWDVLHSNTNSALLGSSPAQERAGAIFKKRGKPLNGWSEADREIPREYYEWCLTWAPEWLRVLKPGGSAIIFAGRRLSHRCISAMEDSGFTYKDMLAWVRERAAHRAQRVSVVFDKRGDELNRTRWDGWKVGNLRPTFEPILWFVKPYPIGTTIADNILAHGLGGFNEKALLGFQREPDNLISCGMDKGEGGLHPTQKPIKLMRTLIELTTSEGQLVLDPFCGSGTTLVAAQMSGRTYLGIEQDQHYCQVAQGRLSIRTLFDIAG
ncbi:MAG: site-specific DNA-methyltransferase [Acidobacteriaceae bacterium]